MAPKRKSAAAMDSSTVSKKLKHACEWDSHGSELKGIKPLMFLDGPGIPASEVVYGFDIDGTIITTKSGRTFPTGQDDWKWLYPSVPDKLRKLHKEGSKVVFFTNQAGIEKSKTSPQAIMQKITNMISEIGIPIQVFVATGTNHFRKPSCEMWDFMEKKCNGNVSVNRSKSYYVGDAAGRIKDWEKGKSKDFSCGDRKFASNLGVGFQTPEEFFLSAKPTKSFEWRSADPQKYTKCENPYKDSYHSSSQEMVIMVGQPASGKSTFTKKFFVPHGYVHVNMDTLKTEAKCISTATAAIKDGKSVVVDNTNSSQGHRAKYIQIAKSHSVPVRCFFMNIDSELAHHLNFVRQNQTSGEIRRIPDVAYNVFKKNFVKPTLGEGFSAIEEISFSPVFTSARNKSLFFQWTE